MFIDELPAPTWSTSENNLLPKWMRYLEWHQVQYGSTELDMQRNAHTRALQMVEDCKRSIQYYTNQISEFRKKLTLLQGLRLLTDDEITVRFEALMASPHVTGVRIGDWGDLIIMVHPVSNDTKFDYGTYEISAYSLRGYGPTYVGCRDSYVYQTLRRIGEIDQVTDSVSNEHHYVRCQINTLSRKVEELQTHAVGYNLVSIVDMFVAELQNNLSRYTLNAQRQGDDGDGPFTQPGYDIGNPVQAVRRMVEEVGLRSPEHQIRDLEENMQYYSGVKDETVVQLRNKRTRVRELAAELRKLEGQVEKKAIDAEEAKRTLRYISTLPGVIAIRFNGTVPVLHVRNSFVRNGKRYDLGDFEINLELAKTHFGTVLRVERTRCPAGGDYTAGWHEGSGFCFGSNRSETIEAAFRGGDICHALNLAIGTMNSINRYDEDEVLFGGFAEIPLAATWQRTPRTRPRRRAVTA